MSQGNAAIGGSGGNAAASGDVLHELMRRGRSFSGRERNCCFLNLANGRFADVSAVSGFDFPDDGRAVARVDWDHDGDLDLWIVNRNGPQLRLLRNDYPRDNHWLKLRLVGNGTTSNRDAIGARVTLRAAADDTAATRTLSATLRAGEGFLSQSSKWLQFGLGNSRRISQLSVRWPDGQVQVFTDVGVDRHYRIDQRAETIEPWQEPARTSTALVPSPIQAAPSSTTSQVLSASFLPLPPISYETFTGEQRHISQGASGSRRATLLNLWASWCSPCVRELAAMQEAASRIQAAGVDVVALAVDGVEGETSSSATAAAALIERLGFTFSAGRASAETIDKLQLAHDHLFDLHQPLAVPTSWLLDPAGRIVALYRGPVDVERLLRDVEQMPIDYAKAVDASVPFSGHWQGHRTHLNPYRLVGKLLDHGYVDDSIRYIDRWEPLIPSKLDAVKLRLRIASELIQRSDFVAAERQYHAALKLQPQDATTLNRLAMLLQNEGRIDEAIALYNKTLQAGRDSADVHINLGRAYVAEQQLEAAIRHFRRANELRPDHPKVLGHLGAALVSLGDLNEAQRYFERVLELDPGNSVAHRNLARILAARRDDSTALDHLRRVVEIQPLDATAHRELGLALLKRSETDEGIRHLRRAISLRSDDPDVLNALATALVVKGRLDEAQVRLEQLLELAPENLAARANLASLLSKSGNHEQALWHRRRLAELQPNDARTHANLGVALAKLQKTDDAIHHFRRAVELQPDNTQALNNLAAGLAKQGQVSEAIKYLQRIVELQPQNAVAHASLGNVYGARDQREDAIRHLREAVKIQPDFLNAHHRLAVSLADSGDLDGAIHHFQEVVRLDSQNAVAYVNLGIALLDQGNHDEAILRLERAVSLNPNYAKAREKLAEALERAGRREDASAQLKVLQRLERQQPSSNPPTTKTSSP